MNDTRGDQQDTFRNFLLMSELEVGEPLSQREIAGRLGIALGLVNSYLKTLVQKGFVSIKAYPRNRSAYLLTPKGFSEKSRLAFQHLRNFHKLYRVTRQDSLSLFIRLRDQGVRELSFCGLDDLTEIFYLSLQEAGLALEVVMDLGGSDERFFGLPVVSLEDGAGSNSSPIVLSTVQRAAALRQELLQLGVAAERIHGPTLSFEDILREDGGRTGVGQRDE